MNVFITYSNLTVLCAISNGGQTIFKSQQANF